MIVTLTPNPSLDRALDLDRLVRGEVNRAAAVHVHPGGKGINVSRALVAQGIASLAVLPVGGAPGEQLVALLTEQGVRTVPVPVVGPTRTNITIVERAGATTKINAPGTPLGLEEIDALVAAVEEQLASRPHWLVAAGSLPAGTGDAFFVRVAGLAARYGVPLALDTSGVPLVRAVRAGGLHVVKPNADELAELVGGDLTTVGDVVEAAREVISAGNGDVLVSLGAHGALLVTAAGTWWAGGADCTHERHARRVDGRCGRLHTRGVPRCHRVARRATAHRRRLGTCRRPAARQCRPLTRRHRCRDSPCHREARSAPRPEGAVT
jgi:1-phosphofructokinase